MPIPMPITLLYAALIALLLVALTYQVMRARVAITVDPARISAEKVERIARVHGNLTEYAPTALILLGLLEINQAPALLLHGLGVLLVVSRLLHAWGLTRHPVVSFGRIVGIQGTLMMILIAAASALFLLL